MRNYFIFNGIDSRDYGVYISGTGRVTIPEKAYSFAEIPSRNGELIVNEGAKGKNETVIYPAFIPRWNDSGVPVKFSEMAGRLRSWLLSVRGYAELRDSYDERHYRMAAFAGPTSFEVTPTLDAGSFDIEFQCKPQRYIDDPGDTIVLEAGESITVDQCDFIYSEPLIIVQAASGFLTDSFIIDDQTVVINNNPLTYPITIDTRLMDSYDANGVSANRYIQFSDHQYPNIVNGTVITSNDVPLLIEPRWYEL